MQRYLLLLLAIENASSYKPVSVIHPVHIIVPLPLQDDTEELKNPFGLTILKVRPVIDLALNDAYRKFQYVPPDSMAVTYRDSRLSDAHGPNVAIQQLVKNRLDCIIGYAFVYALAPVARMCPYWQDDDSNGIPVITPIGLTMNLDNKMEYQTLTRISGPYKVVAQSVVALFEYHKWTRHVFLFHHVKDAAMAVGECFLLMASIQFKVKEIIKMEHNFFTFNQNEKVNRSQFKSYLMQSSFLGKVIILCASPDTVREIMLAAHELGMATSGDYVFINIDVSTGSHAEKPWVRANETNQEENEKAKEAYRALKTISLRRSDLEEYKNFEKRVKIRAEEKYDYSRITGKEYEMNNFISAFYDAVLLYAIALNETIAAGMDPRNGHNITSKMWGRTFDGITGNVSIDANGDRYSDYSLLDLDPAVDKFVEVAYYSGASNQLKKVTDFHWIGGKPPRDSPICGYDNSKCPKGYPLHVYLLAACAGLILLLTLLFVFFWRRYKLEQELAAMSWKIRWEELDGEESQKKEKKKAKKKRSGGYFPESDPLLRSNSRGSVSSDKYDEDMLTPLAMRMRLLKSLCPELVSNISVLRKINTTETKPSATVSSSLRSSSSGATRKISAMIDRKFSIFTRKKSAPNQDKNGGITGNHANALKEIESGQCSPMNEVQFRLPNDRRVSSPSGDSDYKKKSSGEEEFDISAKKSLSLRNRKLSFFGSIKSGGSGETIAQNNGQIYTKTAFYKGIMVAIKKLNIDQKKYPKVDLSRAQLMELKKMKDLQHDHITRFTGACLDAPHWCIVTEYCPKGSLEDILENDQIKLDNMMKYSLLHDLVKGLYFLHNSEIRSHGRLKSSNCVVDSRFVLKVTDFGLHGLHAMEENTVDDIGEHAFYKKQLWTAPELLRNPNPPPMGTQKGDIYSFSIILHEVLWRKGVFPCKNENLSPYEIVQRVKKTVSNPDDVFRPYVPDSLDADDEINQSLLELMRCSWAEDPHDRPDISMIRKAVRMLNKDNETSNLVDNLLKRLELYAKNLEGLVEERTREYLAEKQKVEDLLHQLLPPSIADQLISGKAVQAESYDSVTIYFSDIVGFTALSSQSTPLQVVTLLNDLYLAFDGVVDNFKVYKVETIGDAYMVVSGLPERREDHASQIAQMSLALLHKVKNFVIRHRPNDQLKLRIGMHSGSVVAGVVGSKMPRYCLFGDTVNTSSRMESNGLPLRIHVSSVTKEILSKDTGFRLELRGEVEMKGKGRLTTYWLKGYRDISIPDFGPEYQ